MSYIKSMKKSTAKMENSAMNNSYNEINFDNKKSWFTLFFSPMKWVKKYANQLFKSEYIGAERFFLQKCKRKQEIKLEFFNLI